MCTSDLSQNSDHSVTRPRNAASSDRDLENRQTVAVHRTLSESKEMDLALSDANTVSNSTTIGEHKQSRASGGISCVCHSDAAKLNAAQTVAAAAESDERDPQRWKVLIIEDQATLRRLLRRSLERRNIIVDEAADGAEGLRMMQEHSYHCVFSDLTMPILEDRTSTRL